MKHLALVVALLWVHAATAQEPMRYMGGTADQAMHDSVKDRCRESAIEETEDLHYFEQARKSGIMFAECMDRAFEGRGGRYSAIAYGKVDDGLNDAYSLAWGASTLRSAAEAAINGCESEGGRDCHLRHYARNGCIAYARGPNLGQGVGSAEAKVQAERIAIDHCDFDGCEIVWSRC